MTAETDAAGSDWPERVLLLQRVAEAVDVAFVPVAPQLPRVEYVRADLHAAALARVAALEARVAELEQQNAALAHVQSCDMNDIVSLGIDRDALAARLAAVREAVESRRAACAGMARLDESDRAYGDGMDVALAFVLALLDAPATPTGPKDGEPT